MKVTNKRLEFIVNNSHSTVQRGEIESIALELRKWRCLLPGEEKETDSDTVFGGYVDEE